MKEMKIRFLEAQTGMRTPPYFIYKWIKNFDGATIEFSESHLKIIPKVNDTKMEHPFPLLTSIHKKTEDEEYIKSGPLISALELIDSNHFTETYLGHFENGWKFRFITISSLIETLNKYHMPSLDKAVCIADYDTTGWAIYFDITV